MSVPNSTNFVHSSSFEPPVSEVVSETVKPIEVTPPRKIRVDLKESKPKESTLSKDKMHGNPVWVYHFCGKSGHIRPNYYALIGELVKVLNLYSKEFIFDTKKHNFC